MFKTEGGYRIAEYAEMWELPKLDSDDSIYAFYPVVFDSERYPSFESADRMARVRFPWILALKA